jgi:exodeoxyribonuclease VII large subunit
MADVETLSSSGGIRAETVTGAGGAPLTVAALNRAVAASLARGFPLVRVLGEVANFTRAASGHWYFTLKDDQAQVRCVMFRGRNSLVGFVPTEGDAVEVLAQVNLYEPRGEFQLALESLRRAGLGQLFEEFLRLKERLGREGLFDAARKRPLPGFPRAVGIVTSLQAAALRDVIATLQRRAPHVGVVVYPVPVQGAGSAERIAAMLAAAGRRGEVDVLLLVRGGGSLEDLWAFNEEPVARAIRACALPVVVGVGHESDVTIADFAADLRAPTPTAAAELVAPERQALLDALRAADIRRRRYLALALQTAQQRLDTAWRLLASPRAPLLLHGSRIDGLRRRLSTALDRRVALAGRALTGSRHRLALGQPSTERARMQLAALGSRLPVAARRSWSHAQERLVAGQRALVHLDPLAVLGRGYALVRDAAGRSISRADALQAGQPVDLRFAAGSAVARIEQVSTEAASDPDRGVDSNGARPTRR